MCYLLARIWIFDIVFNKMCSLQDSFRVTFIAKLCRYIALAKIQPPFSRFYISLTIQANLDIDTFKCLLHVWQSVSWLWHFLLDLIHSREKQLCMHKKVNILQFKFWTSTFWSILWLFDCTTKRPFWPPKVNFWP